MMSFTQFFSSILVFSALSLLSTISHASTTPLQQLDNPDSRAAYCRAVTGTSMVKAIGRDNNATEGMKFLRAGQSWDKEIHRLFPDKKQQQELRLKAAEHLSKFAKKRANDTSEPVQEAEFAIVALDVVACEKELLVYQQRTPQQVKQSASQHDDALIQQAQKQAKEQIAKKGKLIQSSTIPKGQKTPATIFKTYALPREVIYIDEAYLALWRTSRWVREGIVLLIKDKQRCIGRITLPASQEKEIKNSFIPITKASCAAFTGGHFEYNSRGGVRIYWKPDGFKPKTIEDVINLRKQYEISFNKANRLPADMNSFVASYQTNKQLAEAKTPEEQQRLDAAAVKIRQAFSKPSETGFSDPELIGVWQGEFVNKDAILPAEFAVWSANVQRYQQLAGAMTFKDGQCSVGLGLGRDKLGNTMGLSRHYLGTREVNCDYAEGHGFIYRPKQKGGSTDELHVYLVSSEENKKSLRKKDCLQKFAREGCYAVGIFRRSKASNKLIGLIKSARWPSSAPPDEATWAVIRDNQPVPQKLKQAHLDAMAYNAEVTKQIQRENEIERQKLIAKYKREIAEDKMSKANKRQAQKRLAMMQREGSSAGVMREPENPGGPFDSIDGASFFNSLYLGDFDAVRYHSHYYGKRKWQGIKGFMGNQPHWSDGIMKQAFSEIRLTSIFDALYLFGYQHRYAECLKKDAVVFTLTETTPDVVTTNLLGVEVARTYGSTTVTEYAVNKEFASIFRRVGRMKPDNVSMSLVDMLVGGFSGKPDLRNQIISGTQQIFDRFECDSKVIQKLEANMIAFGFE